MRLSAPTRRTFAIGFLALVLGIALWGGWLGFEARDDIAFWLTAGGGVILAVGSIFTKL